MFRTNKQKNKCPCNSCLSVYVPRFLLDDFKKLKYGIVDYWKDVRPNMIIVLNKDIPHEECRSKLIKIYDEKYGKKGSS